MNPANSVPFWQQSVWQQLQAYIRQRRIPQALLLAGTAGLGKRKLAEAFAGTLLCSEQDGSGLACGSCVGCTLFQAGTHPDYQLIKPDEPGKSVGIDKIRDLVVKLALKPQCKTYRPVVFHSAEMLTGGAANAFLKCLEEPGERTCFVLVCADPVCLPATIRSRCQKIVVVRPDRRLAEQWLQQQGVTEQESGPLLKLARGAPFLAKEFSERHFLELRGECFEAWMRIAEGKLNLFQVAEQWQKKDAAELDMIISWLAGWLRDIVVLKQVLGSAEIDNPDFKNSLQGLVERLKLKDIFRYYDTVLHSRSQLASTVNKQLLAENLLIEWSKISTASKHG